MKQETSIEHSTAPIKAKYRFEQAIFNSLLWMASVFPERWISGFGRTLGLLLFWAGVRRSVVDRNLEIAFGDTMTLSERRQLAKRVYQNVIGSFFEVLLLQFIPPEKIGNYIEIEGGEYLVEAKKEGKGVLMAGSHFGAWELLSAGICSLIAPFSGYAGKQKNPIFDRALNGIRSRFGMIPISKSKSATREMLTVLKHNEILGILGDLNVPHDHLFVSFFGKKAAVGPGLATFAVAKKAPLFFIWNVRQGPLKYKGYITPLTYTLTGDKEQDLAHVAQVITDKLEQVIRQHPDHYFWFNRRWKTRPPEDRDEDVY